MPCLAFYLMLFYTDVVGLSPSWVGIALFAGRIWDVVNDPMMGQLSDRTVSRWGHRRPYLLFGALPLSVCYLLYWMAPVGFPVWVKVLYLMFSSILFHTLHTVVIMPYWALGAEMTMDYHERTALMSYRQGLCFPEKNAEERVGPDAIRGVKTSLYGHCS